MTTPPLPAIITSKLHARSQSVRFSLVLREVRQFRAYCCNIDSDAIMGVAKEPVIQLDVSPNPVCTGSSIDWDLRDSYAPGSTITSWEIDFGDGDPTETGGDISTAVGTHTYAAAGNYQIEVTIVEGTGLDQTSKVWVTVIDCGQALGQWTYASTLGNGVYVIDWTADVPAWTAINTGLVGNALYVNSLVMKPGSESLPLAQHELWVATQDGIYKTINGGASWAKLTMPEPSNLEYNDSPATTVGELNWHHIVFDPTDSTIIYILASKG